jgi:cell division GTPase FtsZ
MMSTGTAGENAAVEAAARDCQPAARRRRSARARGVLINIAAPSHVGISEIDKACNMIWEATGNPDVPSTTAW